MNAYSNNSLSCFATFLQQYDKYMAANDVSKGGSFYLQSKVYRAKELLDEYVAEKKMEDRTDKASDAASQEGNEKQQQ